MKNEKLKSALGLAVATLLIAVTANTAVAQDSNKEKVSPGTATAQEQNFAKAILDATASQDHAAFIANGNPAFKTIKEPQFKALSTVLSPRLKAGYHLVCLGALNKEGYHTTIWKITYDDGSDDDLLKLSVKNGKIGGALIQ